MQIITFFAAKGGVGRTTAVRATASALLWAHKRVLILDLTSVPKGLTPLQEWQNLMAAQGFGQKQLSVQLVRDIEHLAFALRFAEREKVDYVLVDTPNRPTDLVLDTLRRTTIIVAPANGDTEAALVSEAMDRYQPVDVPAYGLITGVRSTDEERFVRSCFVGMPTLKYTLPRSDLFRRQSLRGDLFLTGSRDQNELTAESKARHLGEELMMICLRAHIKHHPPKGYTVNQPLATGHPLAHLRELHRRNPQIIATRSAE
ncbi:MAG: hypothetical protein GVY36_18305 [Verrucomicrobia bacterium]|jgi:cellulose biosynthesis protein BcsQ|nr:hypothetical protein [Verrucomicrobiota bacterium]